MNKLPPIYLALILLVTQTVTAAEIPKWSFEFKGGGFESDESQWSDFYGNDRFPAYAMGIGYKLIPQIELGVEAGYLADEGQGFAPSHNVPAGNVKYRLYPLHLQLTARGIFNPDQWLIPYVGASWSRFSYRIEPERQSDITGATEGYQYRAGLQLLLDNLDKNAAATLSSTHGIENTYFFLEAQQTRVSIHDTDLGGTAYLGGLRIDF